MTKKTFLIPWFGVLTILIALSLVVNSGPVEAREYRKQPSSIPAFNAFLSDQADGGLANAIIGDQISYISELSLDDMVWEIDVVGMLECAQTSFFVSLSGL